MNPCASDFTPLSSPVLTESGQVSTSSSSSLLLKDVDDSRHHDEPAINDQETGGSLFVANNPYMPYIPPSVNISALPDGLHLGPYVIPRLAWNTALWYNQMTVAGSHCPTPPLFLPATFHHIHPGFNLQPTDSEAQTYTHRHEHHAIQVPSVLNGSYDVPIATGGRALYRDTYSGNGATSIFRPVQLPANVLQSNCSRRLSSSSAVKGNTSVSKATPDPKSCNLRSLKTAKSVDTDGIHATSSRLDRSCSVPVKLQESTILHSARSKRSKSRDMRRSSNPTARVCGADNLALSKRRVKSAEASKPEVICNRRREPLNLSDPISRALICQKRTAVDQAKGGGDLHYEDNNTKSHDSCENVVACPDKEPLASFFVAQTLTTQELDQLDGAVNEGSKGMVKNKEPTAIGDSPAQSYGIIKGAESGSWSQSKRWMSQETKERMVFHKMMQKLHHLAADQSPFIPQTPAELTAFRADVAGIKKKRLSQQVSKRIEKLRLKKRPGTADSQEERPLVDAPLLGKFQLENSSPVFASRTCFNASAHAESPGCAPWPSLAELKEDGDRRASRFGRYLPLPRVNGESQATETSISGDKRKHATSIRYHARFIMPVSPFKDGFVVGEVDLQIEDIPEYLRIAIEEMEKEILA